MLVHSLAYVVPPYLWWDKESSVLWVIKYRSGADLHHITAIKQKMHMNERICVCAFHITSYLLY